MKDARQGAVLHRYLVRVGFWRLEVQAPSPGDVVREARRRLADELPRLWDVIQRLDDSRFEVTQVEPARVA